LLGSARKFVSMINAGVRAPITTLEYFADVIDEVIHSPIPESYWEPLREGYTHGAAVATGSCCQSLMPQPVGQSSAGAAPLG
jgi:hypothetical protein